MNKKIYFFAMLAMLLSLPMLTACGDDEPGDSDAKLQTVSIKYSLKLSQAWFDYFSIEAEYIDQDGVKKTAVLTENWNYTAEIPAAKTVEAYYCHIVAKPKTAAPKKDEPVETFTFSKEGNATVAKIYDDGSSRPAIPDYSVKSSMTIAKPQMEAYTSAEYKLMTFACVLTK